jgi:hypothetical protein
MSFRRDRQAARGLDTGDTAGVRRNAKADLLP